MLHETFCIERQCLMTIDEAREDFVAHRQKLHFECPDAACREQLHPKITAVNYDKLEEYKQTPHFRRNDSTPHIAACALSFMDQAVAIIRRDRKKYADEQSNFFKNGETVAAEDVPDEFVPFFMSGAEGVKRTVQNTARSTMTITCVEEAIQYIRRRRPRTSSLGRIVDIFRSMSDNDKRNFELTIGGTRLSFWNIFATISNLGKWHTWPNIYWGNCRVYKYAGSGYTIYFNSKAERYKNDVAKITVTILVRDETRTQNEHLHIQLADAAKNQTTMTCYIFGQNIHNHYPTDHHDRELYCRKLTECVSFKLDNIHNLILREVSPD